MLKRTILLGKLAPHLRTCLKGWWKLTERVLCECVFLRTNVKNKHIFIFSISIIHPFVAVYVSSYTYDWVLKFAITSTTDKFSCWEEWLHTVCLYVEKDLQWCMTLSFCLCLSSSGHYVEGWVLCSGGGPTREVQGRKSGVSLGSEQWIWRLWTQH